MESIEIFAGSKNILYSKFFSKNKFLSGKSIYKSWSWRYKKPSDNSFSFVQINDRLQKDKIIDEEIKTLHHLFQFKVKDQARFDEKFLQAIEGDGHEWTEIATLHSSSLVALLCFYNVSTEHPLSFEMGKENHMCKFTQSYFECQNKIDGAPKPSNIDVVLIGEDEITKESIIVFLESKFSEYLSGGKKEISDIYSNIFSGLKIEELQFIKNNKTWTIVSNKSPYPYCEGIKQMITHYAGLRIKREGFGQCDRKVGIKDNFDKIYLGEILFSFDFDKDKKDNSRLHSYEIIYSQLADYLETLPNKNERLAILPTILTYQQIFNDKKSFLDSNVFKFYQFKN